MTDRRGRRSSCDAAGAVVRTGAIDHFGDRLTLADLGVTDGLKGLGGLVF